VIADGLSMVFLFRDLLHFIDEPDAPVTVLDVPAGSEELLPAAVRRRIPRSAWRVQRARLVLAGLRAAAMGPPSAPPRPSTQHHRSWTLTRAQTEALRARCRREGASVQAAICAAFMRDFHRIHTPVSLRPFLARPVGESVGVFVGSADLNVRFRPALGFWGNARRFHRRLRRATRHLFRPLRVFSKAVPAEAVQRLGRLLLPMTSGGRPFAVTNLGQLDGDGIRLPRPEPAGGVVLRRDDRRRRLEASSPCTRSTDACTCTCSRASRTARHPPSATTAPAPCRRCSTRSSGGKICASPPKGGEADEPKARRVRGPAVKTAPHPDPLPASRGEGKQFRWCGRRKRSDLILI
jgi:hypothetical protein